MTADQRVRVDDAAIGKSCALLNEGGGMYGHSAPRQHSCADQREHERNQQARK
jgi:hypothetical protein